MNKNNTVLNLGNIKYKQELLKKHCMILGGSGSGKTVLSKVFIEELVTRNIPSLIFDTQGDLSSLILLKEETEQKIKDKLRKNIRIYTPGSDKGLPLSINPISTPKTRKEEDAVPIIENQLSLISNILGISKNTEDNQIIRAYLFIILKKIWQKSDKINNLIELKEFIEKNDNLSELESFSKYKEKLTRRLTLFQIGQKEKLFSTDTFSIKKNFEEGKISIIYLNSLKSEKDKELVIASLIQKFYSWMLSNPSEKLQATIVFDEISPYIPSGQKNPVTKEPLLLFFKQSRKYGIGSIIATQNPGDIDYKAFAQFGTWALGRLTTVQDIKKIKPAFKSFNLNLNVDDLAVLKPGNFLIFSPDQYKTIKKLSVRQLHTIHKTLTLNDISKVTLNKTNKKKEEILTSKIKHIPININESLVRILAEKHRKKFLFKKDESIEDVSLILRPLYEMSIRTKKKSFINKLFRNEIYKYNLLFDPVSSSLLYSNLLNSKNFKKIYIPRGLFKLNDKEIKILKTIDIKERNNIIKRLGLDKKAFNKIIRKLLDLEVIKISEKENYYKNFSFNNIDKYSININKKYSSLSGIKEHSNLDKKDVANFFGVWYEGDIEELDTIYLPYYKVVYYQENRKRIIYIDSFKGKLIDMY